MPEHTVSPADPPRQIAKLRRILDVTRQMAATTELDDLLRTIVAAACDVLDCERASIFLHDPRAHELYVRMATGLNEVRFPADAGIAGAAAQTRRVVNVPDAYADPRFNREIDKQTGYRTRNLLTIPLENLKGELEGVLQALNKSAGPFDAADEDLAQTLGAQTGVALHRSRLLEEYAEKQRLQRDLDIARSIQQALFPDANPEIAGYEIAGWNRCADQTGGDAYDFIPLTDGRLAIFMADATGHGIGAALVIAQARAMIRAILTVTEDLAEVAARVNDLLAGDIKEGRFVTAFLGVLDPGAHRVEYISAGQGPLLVLTSAGVEARDATGLPLAVMSRMTFDVERVLLPPGGSFVLLTDGFYETANPAGELYGQDRVVECLQAHTHTPVGGLIDALHDAVRAFCANGPQADDLTAVIIRRQE